MPRHALDANFLETSKLEAKKKHYPILIFNSFTAFFNDYFNKNFVKNLLLQLEVSNRVKSLIA